MSIQMTDRIVEQSLAEVARHRVKMPGYYNALAARVLSADAPGEFESEQVGVDSEGHGVYVLFWRTPHQKYLA